jgi:Fur family zinc uptake transcriptional regulator
MCLSLLLESSEPRLRRNQRRIFGHLRTARRALRAYEIVDELGFTAATTVYRALAELIRLGLVHQVPSQNAYVACGLGCGSHNAALMICSDCGVVREVPFDAAISALRQMALRDRFSIDGITVEVVGRCAGCHTGAADRPLHRTFALS